jgi:hypothetical protein
MNLLDKAKTFWRERASFSEITRHSQPSFSQFGEDLVLQILLQPGREGTYVDVGANHPIKGSNTFRLYLRGWNGLAIDPNPSFASEFKKFRPRDRYLTEGVALERSTLTYHAFEDDVYNTFDPSVVSKLLDEGHSLRA